MNESRKFAKFNTTIFNGIPIPTIKLDKLTATHPLLIILLQEDTEMNRFIILGCEICDNSLENLVQLLLRYPKCTNYAKYLGLDMHHYKQVIDSQLGSPFFADIVVN